MSAAHSQGPGSLPEGMVAPAHNLAVIDRAVREALFEETAALVLQLRAALGRMHGQGIMTAARRSILRDLDRLGPQTVPQLARARLISRQDIQPIVNALAREGLVEFAANPAHRRSPLVRLTPRGKELLEEMGRREREIAAQLELPVSAQEIESATAVLRAARQGLESLWQRQRSEETKGP